MSAVRACVSRCSCADGRRLHVVTLSTGAPLLDEPVQVLGPEMDDVQTTLRIHGPLAALVFVGVLASGAGDALPEGTEYSTVVHVYDIRRGALLTVRPPISPLDDDD